MRLLLLSDLHLEFQPFLPPAFVPGQAPDVVVLAGDIANGVAGVTWGRQTFAGAEVIYVPGNHEYYEGALDEVEAAMQAEGRRLGVHVLQDAAVTLGGVRFLGATLWTDFALWGEARAPLDQLRCEHVLMDYKLIGQPGLPYAGNGAAEVLAVDTPVGRFSGRAPAHPLRGADTLALHQRSRHWLAQTLAAVRTTDEALRTVVVTHHFPSPRSCARRFTGDAISAGFGSDLQALMGRCGAWLHGHTHDSCTYVVEGRGFVDTRVVCNPRGYPLGNGRQENPFFRDDLQVVLEGDAWRPSYEAPPRDG